MLHKNKKGINSTVLFASGMATLSSQPLIMKLKLTLSLLGVFSVFMSFGQGTISGTLFDQSNSEPLLFANVLVSGTTDGASTDLDGKYQLELAAGTYTIEASYTGYQTKTIQEVVVKDGQVTYLDIALSEEAELLQEVVVTATVIQRSENALLLLQRNSDKIQDGISSQEMSRYSVGDAAGAMKRVTGATVSGGKYVYIRGLGDRYSISQLNDLIIPSADPYRNSAQLDLIPTNLLDNIITTKTFTPDQPGTFTGGNINIKTKSFPEEFSFTVSLSSSFNSQSNLIDDFLGYEGGDNDYFGFDDGSRERPSLLDEPDVSASLSTRTPLIARLNLDVDGDGKKDGETYARAADRAIRSLSREFTPDSISTPVSHGISISFGDQYKVLGNSLGVILAASFKEDYQNLPNYARANWILQDIGKGDLFNQGDFSETLSTQSPSLNGLLGLAYRIGNSTTITFNGLYNHSTDKTARFIFGERPDNILNPDFLEGRSLVFTERDLVNAQLGGEHVLSNLNNLRIEWKLSQSQSVLYEPMTRFFENQYNKETDTYVIPASNVRRPFYFFRNLEDNQQDAKLDITIPFAGKSGNKVKFGTLITRKDREFEEQRYQIEEHLGFTETYAGDPDVYLADDNIGIISQEGERFILGNYLVNASQLQNIYSGTDDVNAFYGMLTYNLTDKLKFIGGGRYEQTNLFTSSADTTKTDGDIAVNDFLPSISLIYALNDKMNIRAGFSQTLARPNMREIAPFEAFDPLTNETIFGNPDLDRTNIQNYDLRWEWFTNPGEILSLSGYYKAFDNPIFLFYRKAPGAEIQYTNVDKASLYGVELEFRKDLEAFIPALRNFKLSTNISFIQSTSDVKVPEGLEGLEPDERPFEGQPPFIINAALLYVNQDAGIDAVLALNAIGDRLRIIGREGTPDIYDRGRSQLDFTFIKSFPNNFSIKVTAQNILNNRFIISSTNDRFPTSDGKEYIYSDFRTGATFGLSLAYTIR